MTHRFCSGSATRLFVPYWEKELLLRQLERDVPELHCVDLSYTPDELAAAVQDARA